MSEATIHRLYRPILSHFRQRRFERFLQIMRPTSETRILDVGGYPWNWEDAALPVKPRITLLNVEWAPDAAAYRDRYEMVTGDGCAMDYADGSFDIVFSNSVIEHLGTFERQQAFASEVKRVGRSYWVQTPAREFPIEPHLLAPFIHWLPKQAQSRLVRYCTLRGLVSKFTKEQIAAMMAEFRLLSRGEMTALFGADSLLTERLAFLPKSYVAFKAPQSERRG